MAYVIKTRRIPISTAVEEMHGAVNTWLKGMFTYSTWMPKGMVHSRHYDYTQAMISFPSKTAAELAFRMFSEEPRRIGGAPLVFALPEMRISQLQNDALTFVSTKKPQMKFKEPVLPAPLNPPMNVAETLPSTFVQVPFEGAPKWFWDTYNKKHAPVFEGLWTNLRVTARLDQELSRVYMYGESQEALDAYAHQARQLNWFTLGVVVRVLNVPLNISAEQLQFLKTVELTFPVLARMNESESPLVVCLYAIGDEEKSADEYVELYAGAIMQIFGSF